jgi:hypothetical protein
MRGLTLNEGAPPRNDTPVNFRWPAAEIKALKRAAIEADMTMSEFLLACFHARMMPASKPSRPRLPQALAEELKDKAWQRRTNYNALVVEILQQWLDAQGGKGK